MRRYLHSRQDVKVRTAANAIVEGTRAVTQARRDVPLRYGALLYESGHRLDASCEGESDLQGLCDRIRAGQCT